MKTRLDLLLEEIDPDTLYNKISRNLNEALASYPFTSNTIDENDDWQELIADVYRDLALSVDNLIAYADYMLLGSALELLEPRLGPGYEIAAMMRTGLNGGVRGIFNILVEEMENDEIKKRIHWDVKNYWDEVPDHEKLYEHEEYYEKFEHLLPKEKYTLMNLKIPNTFLKALEEHPFMIMKLRSFGSGD